MKKVYTSTLIMAGHRLLVNPWFGYSPASCGQVGGINDAKQGCHLLPRAVAKALL